MRQHSIFIDNTEVIFLEYGFFNDSDIVIQESQFAEFAFRTYDYDPPKTIYILCPKPDDALENIISEYPIIEAGGGIVLNENKECLLIFRLNKWDLPKGKLDLNESIEECAVREVEEECGITNLSIDYFVDHTYHMYLHRDRWVVKKTSWFCMNCPTQTLIPQIEENIQEVRWCTKEQILECSQNMYGNIKKILKAAHLLAEI